MAYWGGYTLGWYTFLEPLTGRKPAFYVNSGVHTVFVHTNHLGTWTTEMSRTRLLDHQRWKRGTHLLVLLLGLPFLVCGQGPVDTGKDANPLEGRPEAIAAGQQLFSSACSGCHGVKGEGGRGPNLADGHLIRDVNPRLLFGAIRKGVPGTVMPPFDWPDEKIWQALAYVSSLSSPAFAARVPGDPQAGGAIFYGKGGCSDCHTILGRGHFVGPDLSNAGMTRSWKQLRDALLDPVSRSRVGFQGVTVMTRSGEVTSGVLRNNTNYSLQVQDVRGNLHLFLMQDVREVKYKTKSLMPDDYDRRLTSQEIEDLLAFLSRQALRPPKPPAALEARPKE